MRRFTWVTTRPRICRYKSALHELSEKVAAQVRWAMFSCNSAHRVDCLPPSRNPAILLIPPPTQDKEIKFLRKHSDPKVGQPLVVHIMIVTFCRLYPTVKVRTRRRQCFAHPTPSVTRLSLCITRHTSHVTRHTSHVTHHTSHVTRHTTTPQATASCRSLTPTG